MDGLFLSIVLTDEKTNESVRIQVGNDGLAALTGRGDLLNWFCDQIPHFKGLLGDSLPEGRVIYVRVADLKYNRYTPTALGNGLSEAAPALLG